MRGAKWNNIAIIYNGDLSGYVEFVIPIQPEDRHVIIDEALDNMQQRVKIPGDLILHLVGEFVLDEVISALEQMDGEEVLKKLLAGVVRRYQSGTLGLVRDALNGG